MDRSGLAKVLLTAARGLLVVMTLFWGGFALLSGIGSADGVAWWQNLPNAAPWVALGGVVWIAFRWPLIGGVLVVMLGLGSVFFFHAWTAPFVLFGVSMPLLVAGTMLVLASFWQSRQPR